MAWLPQAEVFVKYLRINDGGFYAVRATERTRRGLRGALPARVFGSTPSSK